MSNTTVDERPSKHPAVRKALLAAIKTAHKAGQHELANALQIIRRNWLGLKPEPIGQQRARLEGRKVKSRDQV